MQYISLFLKAGLYVVQMIFIIDIQHGIFK